MRIIVCGMPALWPAGQEKSLTLMPAYGIILTILPPDYAYSIVTKLHLAKAGLERG